MHLTSGAAMIGDSGERLILDDGSRAVTNASGGCAECCGCPESQDVCGNCSGGGTPFGFTVGVNTLPSLCSGCVDEEVPAGNCDDCDAEYYWGGLPSTFFVAQVSQSSCLFRAVFDDAFLFIRYCYDDIYDAEDFVDGDCYDGTRTPVGYDMDIVVQLRVVSTTKAILSVYATDIVNIDKVLFVQEVTIPTGVCTDDMSFDSNSLTDCGAGAYTEAPANAGYTVLSDGHIVATGGNFDLVCGDQTS